ncbi:hypothetical protein HCZ30_15910 [Marivivens donghaensis]|uniref:Uncharacterized protein n=1 Tax=Marivivens donghaensis TaxID=1699413 RepID=A0ABX0W136_9RHOB|nr:hypothetical protein [Marivivens donghaensis]NIY73916.1 hypothetical protein [Marivivens donghaensis]
MNGTRHQHLIEPDGKVTPYVLGRRQPVLAGTVVPSENFSLASLKPLSSPIDIPSDLATALTALADVSAAVTNAQNGNAANLRVHIGGMDYEVECYPQDGAAYVVVSAIEMLPNDHDLESRISELRHSLGNIASVAESSARLIRRGQVEALKDALADGLDGTAQQSRKIIDVLRDYAARFDRG